MLPQIENDRARLVALPGIVSQKVCDLCHQISDNCIYLSVWVICFGFTDSVIGSFGYVLSVCETGSVKTVLLDSSLSLQVLSIDSGSALTNRCAGCYWYIYCVRSSAMMTRQLTRLPNHELLTFRLPTVNPDKVDPREVSYGDSQTLPCRLRVRE